MSGTTRHLLRGLALLTTSALALVGCAADPASGPAGAAADSGTTGSGTAGSGTAGSDTSGSDTTGGEFFDITMRDIAFDAPTIVVAAGTPVTFHFENTGAARHDAFIGDAAAQADHEQEMAAMASTGGTMAGHDMGDHGTASDDSAGHDMGGMEGMTHGDGNALSLAGGEHGMLTHTFDEPGTYEIGCHQPGHYAAGMRIEITVV